MKRRWWLILLVTVSKLAKSPLIYLVSNEKIENQSKTSYPSMSGIVFFLNIFSTLSLPRILNIDVNESKAT